MNDLNVFIISTYSAFSVSLHHSITEEQLREAREGEVFFPQYPALPIHLSPLYNNLQRSERVRNSSLTTHAGSQSNLNASLSCLKVENMGLGIGMSWGVSEHQADGLKPLQLQHESEVASWEERNCFEHEAEGSAVRSPQQVRWAQLSSQIKRINSRWTSRWGI